MSETNNRGLLMGGVLVILGGTLITGLALFMTNDTPTGTSEPAAEQGEPTDQADAAPSNEADPDGEEGLPEAEEGADEAGDPDEAGEDEPAQGEGDDGEEPAQVNWAEKRIENNNIWRTQGLNAARAFAVRKGLDDATRDKMLEELEEMYERSGVIVQEYDQGISNAKQTREAKAAARASTASALQDLLGEEAAAELRAIDIGNPYGNVF